MYKVVSFFFLFVAFSSVYAQNTDRKFLDAAAQKKSLPERKVNDIFAAKKGELISLTLSDGSVLDFVVTMNEWNQELVRTIGGKLPGDLNTYFTITQLDEEKGIVYEGSIISRKSETAYKIYGNGDAVVFEKTSKDKVVVTD